MSDGEHDDRSPWIVDAHQHVWEISRRRYDWIGPDLQALDRDFTQGDARTALAGAGITGRILVQAADSYEDTMGMLAVAHTDPSVLGVVGWVPLDRPDEAAAALGAYAGTAVVGIRTLAHDYPDPRWLLRDEVAGGVEAVAAAGLPLDVAAVTLPQLEACVELAARHPSLTVVLDHLGRPPVAGDDDGRWAGATSALAAHPTTAVKLSGLVGAASQGWSPELWRPHVTHALEVFGAARTMIGSDWPMTVLGGDPLDIWHAHVATLDDRTEAERLDILAGTATRIYRLRRTP